MIQDYVKKYYRVVIAQAIAFGISWVLVTKVFLGPLPVLRDDFKESVKNAPAEISAYVKELPSKISDAFSKQNSDKADDSNSGSGSYFPDPWIFDHTGNPELTPRQEDPNRTQDPTPTSTIVGRLPTVVQERLPIPTSVIGRNPTSAPQPTSTPRPTSTVAPTQPVSLQTLEKQTLDEINKARQEHGVGKVHANAQLMNAAREHASWMNGGVGYQRCGHDGKGGSTPQQRAKKAGHNGLYIGEIVACVVSTGRQAVDGWLGSPRHRAILLDKNMKEVGIGWGNNMVGALFAP